eukprot:Nitzschia sp. Nitz4//scaffold161_size51353//34113//34901//NITZ4_006953-RA/size51353-processed-gene-0.76-mRNA-1//-1//CDS//3329537924//218//frame0
MSVLSAAASTTSMKLPLLRYAAGGWAFFIAENAILSENRTWLISELGDQRYHLVYGSFSTAATVSIAYGYYTIRKAVAQFPAYQLKPRPSMMRGVGGFMALSMGWFLASQAAPKMQIPVGLEGNSVQVRCPFDFSDRKAGAGASELKGLERVTRHPGLWSLGFIGLGQAMLVPTLVQQIWWVGPSAVALLGGAHTDSRFRRGMGGSLSPEYDSQTSNIPFWAMISGQQGSGTWDAFARDVKPLNAAMAVCASALWVARYMVR